MIFRLGEFCNLVGHRRFGSTALSDGLSNDGPTTLTVTHPGLLANWRDTSYGVFVQDDWRIGSRLTLNLGLRYDLEVDQYVN